MIDRGSRGFDKSRLPCFSFWIAMKYRLAFVILVLLAGAFAARLRLPELADRPMHTDEAVHAWKLGDLLERDYYRYDPFEYHGPTLNYLTVPIAHLRGQNTHASLDEVTLRLVPAIFGIALVVAALLLLDGLGGWAVAIGAMLTALSPAMSYYSRYYIMEVPLVLFTFLLIAAGYRYAKSGRLGWCLLGGAAAGLMYATKETWVFSIAAMVAALAATVYWERRSRKVTFGASPQTPVSPGVRERLWNWRVLAALAAWAIVAGVFFSSFFTNARGLWDAVATYGHAFSRAFGGSAEGGNLHVHSWYYYFQCLFYTQYLGRGPIWTEAFIGVLAIVGMVAGFVGRGLGKADGRLVRFLAVYTVVLMGIYVVLPYKTPWCVLGPLHGMILLAGVGGVAIWRWMPRIWLKVLVGLLLLAGTVQLGYQARRTNFRFSYDRRNPWVYAHTLRGVVKIAERVDGIASIAPSGHHTRINVFTPDNHDQWPLPWYLRHWDRDQLAYYTEVPEHPDAPIIIFSTAAWPELKSRLKDSYQYEYVGLRPAVVIIVGIRQDLWKKYRDEVLVRRGRSGTSVPHTAGAKSRAAP